MIKRLLVLLFAMGILTACSLLNGTPTLLPTTSPQVVFATVTERHQPSPPTNTISPPPTDEQPIEETPTLLPTLTPTPVQPLVFAVIGDYGMAGKPESDVANLVKGWQPAFIITTGDNNYRKGSAATIDENIGQYYHEYIYNYQGNYGKGSDVMRFFPSLGNHDWDTPNAQPYLDYFTLPGNERYYEFSWGPVHFFVLDSDSREPDGVGISSKQAQWLKEKLQTVKEPWKVVYFHHPPYSSAIHGDTDWMQWPFKEWGASLVLAGHDHVYERIMRDGFPYITIGSSGNPSLYNFKTPVEGSSLRYNANYGALRVEATENQLVIEFITRDNELIDRFTLGKTPESPNAIIFPNPDEYTWKLIGEGYNRPVLVTHAGDNSGRLFIVEQPGIVRIIQDGTLLASPFLDIRERVKDQGNEQGLLGLAFHPQFAENGYFFVYYTDKDDATLISRFERSSSNPNIANPDTEVNLLRIAQPYRNHNGGNIAFGPDGYLYIGTGDGGSAGDPQGNAQNPNTLLGKLLRIDVNNTPPYTIPPTNPYLNGEGLPEIWAIGLRNPWRFAFDTLSGDLYIGDVGQNQWEEIDYLPAGQVGGANFGWDYYEGTHPFEGTAPQGVNFIFPIAEYGHNQGCSITGGRVYRGEMPAWQGIYLYGDYCSGKVWGLLKNPDGTWQNRLLFETDFLISSFGEDQSGNLYLVDHRGGIYTLSPKQ